MEFGQQIPEIKEYPEIQAVQELALEEVQDEHPVGQAVRLN